MLKTALVAKPVVSKVKPGSKIIKLFFVFSDVCCV